VFSGKLEERDGSYEIDVPTREVRLGNIEDGETYRVALVPSKSDPTQPERDPQHDQGPPAPPVTEGDERTVEIDEIGDQGDGITRVERGYVVIVPDTDRGERVTIRITDVRENVAFATVTERVSYYE
jgi:predicted RNA-binding protein with TRAM domain